MSKKKTDITKAESSNPKLSVDKIATEIGQPYIVDGGRFIRDQKAKDLQYPRFFDVAHEMYSTDAAVHNCIDMTNVLSLNALDNGSVKAKGESTASKEAANFLNYCFRNMSYGSWREAMNSACTDIIHGFSLLHPVYERRDYGKYKGKIVLKKLSPRSQSSVYGWVWDKNNRDLKGVVFKPMLKANRTLGNYSTSYLQYTGVTNTYYKDPEYTFIPSNKLLHFRFNPTDSNPQGNSPLIPCYEPSAEKCLIQQLELIGIQKDMSGVAVLELPNDMIDKGNNPAEYPEEALNYQTLIESVAESTVGKKPVIVLPSSRDDKGHNDFGLTYKGIEGGGKQYSTSDVIEQRTKSIYNIFGAQFIILGQDGHGSNAQSSNQMTIHDYYIQRNVEWKVDVINNQLIPKLLALNGISLDWDDMPYFEAADPSKPDMEILGKTANRLASSGIATHAALKVLFTGMGLPTDGIDEIDLRDLKGSGSEGSGNGNTQAEGMGSDTNNENAA